MHTFNLHLEFDSDSTRYFINAAAAILNLLMAISACKCGTVCVCFTTVVTACESVVVDCQTRAVTCQCCGGVILACAMLRNVVSLLAVAMLMMTTTVKIILRLREHAAD